MNEDIQADLFKPNEPVTDAPPDKADTAPEASKRYDTVREALDAAVKEVNRDEKGRFAKAEGADAEPDTKPDKSEPAVEADATVSKDETVETSSEAKPVEHKSAPQSWSKEAKAHWESLPPSIQAEAHRREADTARGVQQLKAKYESIDKVLTPYLPAIQQAGRTPADVIQQLIGWNYALASPNPELKKAAFQRLAQAFGVDLSTLGSAKASPGGQSPTTVPPEVSQHLQHLTSRVQQFEQHQAAQSAAAAEQTVMSWAKDKPHFQTVRQLMAHMINTDLNAVATTGQSVGGFVKDGRIDLDAAYSAALYATPETRSAVLAEENAKKAAAQKAHVDKARSAAVSVKTGTPASPAKGNGKEAPKNQSVRESIKAAWAEARSR